jgi:hypothetical protein
MAFILEESQEPGLTWHHHLIGTPLYALGPAAVLLLPIRFLPGCQIEVAFLRMKRQPYSDPGLSVGIAFFLEISPPFAVFTSGIVEA